MNQKQNKGKDEPTFGCLILGGGAFLLSCVGTIFGIIFEGKSYLDGYSDEDGEITNFSHLRFTFGLFVVAIIIYAIQKYKSDKRNQDKKNV